MAQTRRQIQQVQTQPTTLRRPAQGPSHSQTIVRGLTAEMVWPNKAQRARLEAENTETSEAQIPNSDKATETLQHPGADACACQEVTA